MLLLFSDEGHAARACRAAYDMRATLRAVGNLSTPSGTVRLRMSVGVHSGDFDLYLVGDPRHHRELLVVGPEVSTTARMERVAAAGRIVVSERTAALLPAGAHGPGPEEGTRLLRRRPGARRPLQVGRVAAEEDEPRLAEHLPAVIREQVLAEPGEPGPGGPCAAPGSPAPSRLRRPGRAAGLAARVGARPCRAWSPPPVGA